MTLSVRDTWLNIVIVVAGSMFLPRGCSSVGRAPALQAGGQEFESPHLHQFPYLDIAYNLLDGSYRDKSGKQSGKQLLEAFIKDRKSTKGLTASGEEWLR